MSTPCPNCGKRLKLPASVAGRSVRCPKCNEKFRAPAAEEPAAGVDVVEDSPFGFDGDDAPAAPKKRASDAFAEVDDEPRPSRRRRPVDDDDDEPPRRRRPRDDDGDDDRPRPRRRPKSRGRKKKSGGVPPWVFIVGGVLAVAGIGVLVYFLIGGGGGGGDQRPKRELAPALFAYYPGDGYRLNFMDYKYARELEAGRNQRPQQMVGAPTLPAEIVDQRVEWVSSRKGGVALYKLNRDFLMKPEEFPGRRPKPEQVNGQTIFRLFNRCALCQPDPRTIVYVQPETGAELTDAQLTQVINLPTSGPDMSAAVRETIEELSGYPRFTITPAGESRQIFEGALLSGRASYRQGNRKSSESFMLATYANESAARDAERKWEEQRARMEELRDEMPAEIRRKFEEMQGKVDFEADAWTSGNKFFVFTRITVDE